MYVLFYLSAMLNALCWRLLTKRLIFVLPYDHTHQIFRRRPCSSFVNRPRALLCQLTCRDDDVVCSLRCLRRHAEVSSWVEATLACLDAIYQSDDAQEAVLLQLCLQAPLEGLTPFQSSLVRGFSTMAECSSNSCGDSVTSFLHDLGSMSSCVAICLEATKSDDQDGILSLVLPKSLACTLNCALAA